MKGIANYSIKQHITIYIGEVLPPVDVVAKQVADRSCPTGKTEVGNNFK